MGKRVELRFRDEGNLVLREGEGGYGGTARGSGPRAGRHTQRARGGGVVVASGGRGRPVSVRRVGGEGWERGGQANASDNARRPWISSAWARASQLRRATWTFSWPKGRATDRGGGEADSGGPG